MISRKGKLLCFVILCMCCAKIVLPAIPVVAAMLKVRSAIQCAVNPDVEDESNTESEKENSEETSEKTPKEYCDGLIRPMSFRSFMHARAVRFSERENRYIVSWHPTVPTPPPSFS